MELDAGGTMFSVKIRVFKASTNLESGVGYGFDVSCCLKRLSGDVIIDFIVFVFN